MYQRKIAQWGLERKHKAPEMRAILRIARQREATGQKSVFRIRGRPIDIREVHRYFKRRGEDPDILKVCDSPIPSTITVETPLYPDQINISDDFFEFFSLPTLFQNHDTYPVPESGYVSASASGVSSGSSNRSDLVVSATQELVYLINNDEMLKSLHNKAMEHEGIECDTFERNYRSLLEQLGSELLGEASNDGQTIAGRLILSQASRIASVIRTINDPNYDANLQQMNDPRTVVKQQIGDQLDIFAEEQSATQGFTHLPRTQLSFPDDSDASCAVLSTAASEIDQDLEDSGTEDETRYIDEMPTLCIDIQAFIERSKAFECFRIRVRRFICPDQLTWIHSELMSHFGMSKMHKICFCLRWNLLEFCEKELDGSHDLAQMLTISGSGKEAFATTCEDYINKFWPRNGARILDALQCAMKSSQRGKLPQKILNERR
jgi:hypothetical protein